MKTPKVGSKHVFEPAGLDLFYSGYRMPQPGTVVTVVQPHGCPKNGTMGCCYVEWPLGGPSLVNITSLKETSHA